MPDAIRKGNERAKKTMFRVPLVGTTIPHRVRGHHGAGKVMLRPASPGTGVIAGPAVRAVMDTMGVHDVLTKSLGTTNPHNVIRATFEALGQLESAEQYAQRTGKDYEDVIKNYTVRPQPVG